MPHSPAENFFIKDGYAVNDAARPAAAEAGPYWTPYRIQESYRYQYHVYRHAGLLARARGLRSALDLGCGTAAKAATLLRPHFESVVLMDQEECRPLTAGLFPEARFIAADLESCEADVDGSFDLIVCADVIEHLRNPAACLDFVRRHLAAAGIAVFSTPERDLLRGQDCMHSPHADHVREWNRDEFRRLLEWKGFSVVEQALYPAARLPQWEEGLRLLTPAALRPRKWKHCQVAVCSVRGKA